MTRQTGEPDDDLVAAMLRRSDGPVVIRPLRATAAAGRRPPYAAVLAVTFVVIVVAGVAGIALNARRRDVAAAPSPSPVATQTSPSGANLAPRADRGFVVNLGGHGIGVRSEADATPYFQVISSTLLSYAVSPNGKLAYWQTGPDDALPHSLHVYDSATRTDRTVLTLTDERGGSSGFMVWSTDGGGLAIGTSDVGSAFEGQRSPARPKIATWSLLDLASGTRRKIATISDSWVVPVSWDRQTDIATATEYGRDGPSTPSRLFYVWNPQRAVGKATQFVLPAAIEPFTARADSGGNYVVGIESLQCAPSRCQSLWMWPTTDPTAASARRITGHSLGAPAFRPGTTDLFALMTPLCCTTPAPNERPTIVELGPPGASTLRTVYTYSPGDANFFFRSDGSAIVVNNGDLNNRKGITVVDPTTGTTILLPLDRDGVQDVQGSIGPGPVRATQSPAPSPLGEIVADDALAGPAYAVALDPARQRIFVRLADAIQILDGNTLQEVASVPLSDGNQWTGLAFDDAYGYLWATSFSGTVSIIATAGPAPTVVATIPVGLNPGPVAVDRRTHLGYVVGIGREAVHDDTLGMTTVVNPNTQRVVALIPARGFPSSVAVNTAAGRAYVSVRDPNPAASSFVQVIGADDLREITTIGTSPLAGLVTDERTNRIYASTDRQAAPAGGFVTAVDGRTAQASTFITLGVTAAVLGIDASRGHVYLASRDGQLVIEKERDDMQFSQTAAALYALPGQPMGIAVDDLRHRVYTVTFSARLVVLRDDWP